MIANLPSKVRRLCLGGAIFLATSIGARADVVTDWNQTAIRATEIAGAPVPVQTRTMAIVHAAIAARTDGLRLGQEVATQMFALRKDDGSTAQQPYTFGTSPGVYQATPPMNISPVLPHWRHLKPFVMTSAKQFAFAGPAAPNSAAFAKDFNEVKRLGSRASTERTPEQTAIAIHWAGSEVPPLNAVARAAAAAKGFSLVDTARLFALLNMAMPDSLIAGFEAKYAFNYWRPVTAIRNASLTKNESIAADQAWDPLLVTPPHPEYPSAHCLGAGAAVAILQHVFEGDRLATSYVYPPLGVLLRWESFSEIEMEVENARVWGGIHYRTAVEHGTQIGRQIAEFAIKTQMRPRTN